MSLEWDNQSKVDGDENGHAGSIIELFCSKVVIPCCVLIFCYRRALVAGALSVCPLSASRWLAVFSRAREWGREFEYFSIGCPMRCQ